MVVDRTRPAPVRLILATLIAGLCAVAVLASVSHSSREAFNPGYAKFSLIVWIHVALGAGYLIFAPFQFVAAIRSRAIGYHRWAGRTLAAIGTLIGTAALFMSVAIPVAGWPERIVVGSFSIFYLYSLAQGVRAIRAKRIESHREWMIRAFAIALAIATTRIIGTAVIALSNDPSLDDLKDVFNASITTALFLHLAVAEVWIRSTRQGVVEPARTI